MTLGGTNQLWDQNSNGSNVSNPYVYLLAVIEPGRVSFSQQLLSPLLPACQSSSIVKCLGEWLLNSFIALSHCFQVPFLYATSPVSLQHCPLSPTLLRYMLLSPRNAAWLCAKKALRPHGHLLGSENSTGLLRHLCVQTYRSSGMQAPKGLGCPNE